MQIKSVLILIILGFCQQVFGDDFINSSIYNDPYISREKLISIYINICKNQVPKNEISENIKVINQANSLSFSYKKNLKDIESISNVQMNKNCEIIDSFNTYYDSNFKPILRVKFDGKGNRIKIVKMKEPVIDFNMMTDAEALQVGIIDTGVDYNHPKLYMKMRPFVGLDLFSNDNLPYDYTNNVLNELSGQHYSHGTAVADLMGRDLNVRIIPVRVASNVSASGEGIEFLAKHGVRIINLSMGTSKKSEWISYLKAVKNHPEILFIVAAGNDGLNIDKELTYPASFKLENQIVVASVNSKGELSSFSNYGINHVDIAVLGEEVQAAEAGGGFWKPSGTSFSAPQLSRFAASLLINNLSLSTQELKAEILTYAKNTPNLADKVKYGFISKITPIEQTDKAENKIDIFSCGLSFSQNYNCLMDYAKF